MMKLPFNFFWTTITALTLLASWTDSLKCENIQNEDCFCSSYENTDIQCPRENPDFSISVAKNNIARLQCLKSSTPLIDLEKLPDLDLSDCDTFIIEYCYFNTSFKDLLKKFELSHLKKLGFDSVMEEDVDKNMTLTKDTFDSLEDLQALSITYSTLYLAEDAFSKTPNLTALILSKNVMTDLSKNMFDNITRMKYLDLSLNQLESISDGLFESLSNLSVLYLHSNDLVSLTDKTFQGLKNLTLLELSQNHIEHIHEESFAPLNSLINISLRGNNIQFISDKHFANRMNLEQVRLSNNPNINLSDYVFANLPRLLEVELSYNNLSEIPPNTFRNSGTLKIVTFAQNMLSSIPKKLFLDLKRLEILDFSANQLQNLPDDVFSSLNNLKILNLSKNRLAHINGSLFRNLYKLERLDLHINEIHTVEINAFNGIGRTLKYLDIRNNVWSNDNTAVFNQQVLVSPLNVLLALEELQASHNRISEFPYLANSIYLKTINLAYNNITNLEVLAFAVSSAFDIEIDLSNNQISFVDFTYAEDTATLNINPENYVGSQTTIKMDNNPIECSCLNYDLVRYNNGEFPNVTKLINIDQNELSCGNTRKLVSLRKQDIFCKVDECLDGCSCSYEPYSQAYSVDCSSLNLTMYPDLTTDLNGYVNVTFDLRYSMNKAFLYSYNQTYLNLSGNSISTGPSHEDAIRYHNVSKLDLSRNRINKINWIPANIKELNLNDNELRYLDSYLVEKLRNTSGIKNIRLKGNPWICDCSSLDLQKYLMQFYHKINTTDIYCQKQQTLLVKIPDLCKVSPYLSIMTPIVLAVFLCLAIVLAIYYRYQTEIKIYMYAKNLCLWFVSEEELDRDKTYDVFISYSNQDEKFVVQNLLPELEHGENPYKVCIHIRDWLPGEFIAEQVVNSVKDSRRTLVVLSNHFLNSVWGRLEFRTAHTEAISEGRARVIVVILEELDESKIDQELQNYLKTNTYVKWGDKYFWNKLKYALPHKNSFYEKNKKHAKVMLKIDDKFDLMKNPPSPTYTSTPPITLNPSLLDSHLNLDKANKIEGETTLLFR